MSDYEDDESPMQQKRRRTQGIEQIEVGFASTPFGCELVDQMSGGVVLQRMLDGCVHRDNLQVGDRLVFVNDVDVSNMTLQEALETIGTEKTCLDRGEPVKMVFQRLVDLPEEGDAVPYEDEVNETGDGPAGSGTFCMCETEADSDPYLRCASGRSGPCHGWVHPGCVGLSPEETETAKEDTTWQCPACIKIIEKREERENRQAALNAASDPTLAPGYVKQRYCVCQAIEDGGLYIECSSGPAGSCRGWVHPGCFNLSPADVEELSKSSDPWFCDMCLKQADGGAGGEAAAPAAAAPEPVPAAAEPVAAAEPEAAPAEPAAAAPAEPEPAPVAAEPVAAAEPEAAPAEPAAAAPAEPEPAAAAPTDL